VSEKEITYPDIANAMVDAADKNSDTPLTFKARQTDENRHALDVMEEILASRLPQRGMTYTRQLSPEGEVIFQIK
jgi:hypothetical protein